MDIEERMRRDSRRCPGGEWCECCSSNLATGCDCGCRDMCPEFRSMIKREAVKEGGNDEA